jgi:hypothetical protein
MEEHILKSTNFCLERAPLKGKQTQSLKENWNFISDLENQQKKHFYILADVFLG